MTETETGQQQRPERREIDPITLSRMLGQKFAPTAQQAAVIGAAPGPLLVVAGAGAGKTETMAARVVWLVANGHVRPEGVLGLTFTRKAARELGQRIRRRLIQLASARAFRRVAAPEVLEALEAIAPTVSTYDAYAGDLVSEYGLLLPAEPAVDILDEATRWVIARDVVRDRAGLDSRRGVDDLTERLLRLSDEMDGNLVDSVEVREQATSFLHLVGQTPPSKRQKKDLHSDLVKVVEAQKDRLELLPLVAVLQERLDEAHARTFGRQMSLAARLAVTVEEVGERERTKFRVVMLDEYQDTSHAQRLLLRSLFAGAAVTAVGDPMQAIYGWRGATATNLTQFPEDFRAHDGEAAPTLQLTTSWRNPPEVLAVANHVSDRAFDGKARTVEPLDPRPGATAGEVDLAMLPTREDELLWVAQQMAQELAAAEEEGRELSAAVLVRRNADCTAVAEALTAAGVRSEIIGVGGLLRIPEVVELLCHLRILVDPGDDEAMLRILTGPRWRLGAKDIAALSRRSRQLESYGRNRAGIDDEAEEASALQSLIDDFDRLVEDYDAPPSGLGYAVADPAIGDDLYSETGAQRIAELGEKLRRLRRWSLRKPLPDIISDVEEEFGLRIELQVAEGLAEGAGPVHLDRMADVAAEYAYRSDGDLAGFLGYVERALARDRGLEPGRVRVDGNRVEILTVHKSKGLEWDVVAVPHVTHSVYDTTMSKTWLTNPDRLLPELIGEEDEALDGSPILDAAGAEDQGQLSAAIKAHKADLKVVELAESERLFYVAVTRAARRLLVSGCLVLNPSKKALEKPSAHLTALGTRFPEAVGTWAEQVPEAPEKQEELLPDGSVPWPTDPLTGVRHRYEDAVSFMEEAARGEGAEPITGDLSRVWADEVDLLIEERRRRIAETLDVPMPVQLSTSEYQSMQADPEVFARRRARPVPFQPNRFARRGTAFHAWLERRVDSVMFLDEEELAMLAGQDTPEDVPLEKLKEKFEQSQWANRVPEFVEVPFDIGIGGLRVVGRIDAIFKVDGRWVVVDWKTGRKPTGRSAELAALQLAVYRLAWMDRRAAVGENLGPDDVRVAFHYVASGETVEPESLPSRDALAEALQEVGMEPTEPEAVGAARDRSDDQNR